MVESADQVEKRPWSWAEFHAAMKAAKWERMSASDPAKAYLHTETGAKFYPLKWSKWRALKYPTGEAWYEFAVLHEVPNAAPF